MLLKLFYPWPVGAPPGWIRCPSDLPPSCFEHASTFLGHKIFRTHLVFFLPQSWNQLLLQGALVPPSFSFSFFNKWYFGNKSWALGHLLRTLCTIPLAHPSPISFLFCGRPVLLHCAVRPGTFLLLYLSLPGDKP